MGTNPSDWLVVVAISTLVLLTCLGFSLWLAPWKRRQGAPETKEAKYKEARAATLDPNVGYPPTKTRL